MSLLNLKYNLSIYLTLIIGILSIFYPVYKFDFILGWDDQWFVTNFYTESGLNSENIYSILTEYYRGQYAPVNQLYYTILYNFAGYKEGTYHISSLIIHFFNTVLIFHFTYTIIRYRSKNIYLAKKVALLTSILFAILPVNVEPIVWVSASKVLLYSFFYLLSLTLYLSYINNKKQQYYYLTLITFIISFFAKEQAVTLPLALVLVDWLYKRNFKNLDLWLEKIPFILLSIIFGLITIESQGFSEGRSFYSIIQRLPLASYTIMEYFTKSLIPINLSFIYPFPFLKSESVPGWMWIYVVLIPSILLLLYGLKNRLITFCVLFFLIHIILVSNITSLARHSLIADRYTYVASIGTCVLVVYFLNILYKKYRKTAIAIASIYMLYLASYSSIYVKTWENTYTLKKRLKNTIESRHDFIELKNNLK